MSVNYLRRSMLGLLALSPVSGLVACGYRLRGMVDLPFKAIAITGNPSPPLRADLQTAILTGTDTKVAINPIDADLILEITNDVSGREILEYNENGQSPKGNDQYFLSQQVYQSVVNKATIHDSYSCKQFANSKPFPTERKVIDHVGSLNYAPPDKIKECPVDCRPSNHKDWKYC